MANLIHSPQHALPSMCASQARVYLEHTVPELFGAELAAAKLWTTVEDDHYYDVYQVTSADRQRNERFYFDVTPFFERGHEWVYDPWLDLPDTTRSYPIWLFFGESELQHIAGLARPGTLTALSELSVTFSEVPSEEASMRVCSRDPEGARQLQVHALRSYATRSIPFLHGFPFYRLFMFHQLVHISQGHAAATSEIGLDGSHGRPLPGRDCVRFRPLRPFDLAHDFLNHMFWTHEPHAFDCASEMTAFAETVRFAVRSGLFTARELRAALANAHLERRLKQRLRASIGLDTPGPRSESAAERVAH